jgi:hypothetical protein
MSAEEIRLEVAMRVFAARFNTDGRIKADKAAEIAWEAADLFCKEMLKDMERREKSPLPEAASK